MRSRLVQLLTVTVIGTFAAGLAAQQPQAAPPQGGGQGQGGGRGGGRGRGGPGMALTSTSWADGGEIPAKYAGQMGVSPQLSWTNVPMGTVEFVLLMHDPEPVVPAGSA